MTHSQKQNPPFPFRRLLGLAVGGLGWSPDAFWRATPQDLQAALDFLAEAQGGLTTETLVALRQRLQREETGAHGT